jgi:hypothetical protein
MQPRATLSLLRPNNLDPLNISSSLNVRNQFSGPYKTMGKIIVSYSLIFTSLETLTEENTKYSEVNGSKHMLNLICS